MKIDENKSKFKVGDKVKLNRAGKQCLGCDMDELEIIEISSSSSLLEYFVRWDRKLGNTVKPGYAWIIEQYLEPIENLAHQPYQFKVADKVQHYQYTKATDFVGEITDVKNYTFKVRWNDTEFQSPTYSNYFAHQLVLAPAFRVGDRVKFSLYAGFNPTKAILDQKGEVARDCFECDKLVYIKLPDNETICERNIFLALKEYVELDNEQPNKEQQFKVGDRVKIINCNLNWHGTVVGAEHNQIGNFVLYLVNWDCKSYGQYHRAFDLEKIEETQPTSKGKKMKVSQLMQDIVLAAEEKFGVSDHINDCITISIGTPYNTDDDDDDNDWGVSLSRPTKRQMDSGEVDNILTMNVIEKKYACRGVGSSLVAALLDLQEQVELANYYDFSVE